MSYHRRNNFYAGRDAIGSCERRTTNSLRFAIYMFLERPDGKLCFVYNCVIFVLILFSLIYNSISSVPSLENSMMKHVIIIDLILFIVFVSEYSLRVWSANCRMKYRGAFGRLKFIIKPLCVLDFVAIIGLSVCLAYKCLYGNTTPNIVIVRCMRFLQLARLFHFDRYVTSWRILWSVFEDFKHELITAVYFAFVFLIVVSYLLWIAEKHAIDSSFRSLADTLYCSLITMATIGYGDKVPKTFIGQLIISTVGILGVFMWSLPAGIIGSGFALKVQEQKTMNKYKRLQPAAASLIQCKWRLRKYESLYGKLIKEWLQSRMVGYTSVDHSVNNGIFMSVLHDSRCSLTARKLDMVGNEVNNQHALHNPVMAVTLYYVILLKYFVAWRKFHKCREPLDIANAMNENARNHFKLMNTIADINRKVERTSVFTRKYENESEKNFHLLTKRIIAMENLLLSLQNSVNGLQKSVDRLVETLN